MVTWPMTQNGQKTKVEALHCSFQNLLELCPRVLPLWRYEDKDFSERRIFFFAFFCFFLHENNSKSHDSNTFIKWWEGAIIVVSWEIWPKMEGAYPKKEIDIDRLQKITGRPQKSLTDHKIY